MAYIAFAFRQVSKPVASWKFGAAAIAALIHDVLVTIGIFAVLGKLFGVEVGPLFITALLTIMGFSVHDTIVVFDRIRENLKKNTNKSFNEVVNDSLMETLVRSLRTSMTVVLVLIAMLLFGSQSIFWFVVALLIGIISGTYSSIFTAAQLLVVWHDWDNKERSKIKMNPLSKVKIGKSK
jgi:preprotein translocase subunit SecF